MGEKVEYLLIEKDESIISDWYQKRRYLFILGCIQKTIIAFQYASTTISALFYYRLMIKSENPVFYYSVAMGVMFFTASCSAIYGGWYIDKTRSLRKYHLIANLFSIVGNLIYVVPYSKWCPILGRALCGISDSVQPGLGGKYRS